MSEFPNLFFYYVFARRVVIWSYTQEGEVGTATRYGLGGPDIGSRWRREFPCPFCLLSLSYDGSQVFPGGVAAGTWC
jgi:hypothetical protein